MVWGEHRDTPRGSRVVVIGFFKKNFSFFTIIKNTTCNLTRRINEKHELRGWGSGMERDLGVSLVHVV